MEDEDLKEGCIASRYILRVFEWWRRVWPWREQQLVGMVSCTLGLLGSRLLACPELAPVTLSLHETPPLTILLVLLPVVAPAALLYMHTTRRLLRTCHLYRHRLDEIRSAMHVIHKGRGLSASDSAWLYSVYARGLAHTEAEAEARGELQRPARARGAGDAGGGGGGSVGALPRLRPCSARR